MAAGVMSPGAAPGRAQQQHVSNVFDEADLVQSHSGSVASSEVDSTREFTKNSGYRDGHLDGGEDGEGEPWGGMIFGQLLDRSPMKVLVRSSFT